MSGALPGVHVRAPPLSVSPSLSVDYGSWEAKNYISQKPLQLSSGCSIVSTNQMHSCGALLRPLGSPGFQDGFLSSRRQQVLASRIL